MKAKYTKPALPLRYRIFVGILVFFVAAAVFADVREYHVKAAFVHKFTLFTDYPQSKSIASRRWFNICIPGENPFGDAFRPVEGKMVHGRPLAIRHLPVGSGADELKTCDVVYLQNSVSELHQRKLIGALQSYPILTIGEHEDFLHMGGIIRLYKKRGRIVFSVNTVASRRTGIRFRSQMLRIAEDVIYRE